MRARPVYLAVVLASFLAAFAPLAARAETTAAFDRDQTFQKRNWQNFLDEMPELDKDHPAHSASEILSLSMDNGVLDLHTSLPTTPQGQPQKLKFDTFSDWSLVAITGGATGKDAVIPDSFTYRRTDFDPGQTDVLMIQHIKNSILVISQQITVPTGTKNITFQSRSPNAVQAVPAMCILMISNQNGGVATAPQTWQSANFSAFTREHPVESDRYIRPLMHALGQDAALAPDPMLAFQVFSEQWTPDPAVAAKVDALVASLGNGNFHTRAHAQHELAALGLDAIVVLIRTDRTKLGPEQNARVDKLIAPYQPVPAADAKKLLADPAFLLDCLYSDDLTIRKAALARLTEITQSKIDFDPTAAAPARAHAIPPLLQQLIAAKIIVPKS